MASLAMRPIKDRARAEAGVIAMTNCWTTRIACMIPVALVAWAAVEGYRAYIDPWRGSLRAPLIDGSLVAIALFVVGTAAGTLHCRWAKGARPGG